MKRILLTSTILALMSGFSANAADMSYPVSHSQESTAVEYGSGWYLRGDIGYSKASTSGVEYRQATYAYTGSFESYDIDDNWSISGGFGLQLNENIRADFTINHNTTADFSGSSATGVACGAGVCDYSESSTLGVTTLLVNGYYDFGRIGGFTPYVGAGAGMAKVSWSDLNNSANCVSGACTLPANVSHGGASEFRFAYALHAGASIDLNENFKLDAGYSYMNIAGGDMFDFEAGNALSGLQGRDEGMEIHTIHAGLRYQIW